MDPAESSWLGEAAKKSLAVAPHGSKTLPPASTHHSDRHLERGISNAANVDDTRNRQRRIDFGAARCFHLECQPQLRPRCLHPTGDLVIIFASRDKNTHAAYGDAGEHVSNMFGHFPHDDMVRCRTAARWFRSADAATSTSSDPRRALTLALPHRTQILYAPDMSFISNEAQHGLAVASSKREPDPEASATLSRAVSDAPMRARVRPRPRRADAGAEELGGLPNDLQQNLSRGRGQPREPRTKPPRPTA